MSEVRADDIVAGKFQIERIIGEGGMGYVAAARHLQLGQRVALKFVREEVLNEEFKSRFLREARNTVRLKSKHVSRVLDVGSLESGAPYMVMEYLEGTDLSALLQERGPFPVAEACDYVIQACEAIAEAHSHGIIHRDLKPANLFLTHGSGGEPVVKVLDFGVSKIVELDADLPSPGRREHYDSVVTKATDLLGSPTYMAPEQAVSASAADSRSDVWSLGVILFRLISGKAPFTGASLGGLIQNIMHGPVPNLRDYRPDLPEGLEFVLWRCMDRDGARRPDAIELARMLSPYAGPNAAPSIERIAVLGPALITAVPQPTPSAPSLAGQPSWTGPPGIPNAPIQNTKRDTAGASSLVWVGLFAVVALSIAIAGVKLFKLRHEQGGRSAIAPPSFEPNPLSPQQVEPRSPSLPVVASSAISTSLPATPTPPNTRVAPHATHVAHDTRARPSTTPARSPTTPRAPTPGIPATRD